MPTLLGDFYDLDREHVVSPIEGWPFQAQYVETHSRPSTGETLRRQGPLSRNGQGSVRREHILNGAPGEHDIQRKLVCVQDRGGIVRLFDSMTRQTQKIDFNAVLRGKGGGSPGGACPVPADQGSSADVDISRELLGTRVIEGFLCHGIRHRMGDEVSETWLAGDLKIEMLQVGESPTWKKEYRVFNITLGEPDPDLFALPNA